ncbi:MAG: hypothetical protein CVV02_12820 [Firmicutes bacterium HGW-Firmicutes-7]|nr:MAG: hypothetical protein CVV02_12820 [Firmicutes bacterium HGW-Firmicutes-7]
MEEYIRLFIKNMGVDSVEDIKDLYQDYMYECNQLVMEIDTAFKDQFLDHSYVEKIVHNLKGVSANLYVHDVYENASKLDDALLNGDSNSYTFQEILNLWHQTHLAYNASKNKIVHYFKQHGYTLTS